MKSYDAGDGWFTTTPIYATPNPTEMTKAMECEHEFVDSLKEHQFENDHEVYLQRCTKCIAVRGRHRIIDPTPPQQP